MHKAVRPRLVEGEALVALGHWDGGIYLLGYVAEMVLKIAYCRLDPTLSSTTVVKDVFGVAAGQWRGLFRTNLPKNYVHDVLFWEVVLSEQRRTLHKPLLAAASPRAALILSRCFRSSDSTGTLKCDTSLRRHQNRTRWPSVSLSAGFTPTKIHCGVELCR